MSLLIFLFALIRGFANDDIEPIHFFYFDILTLFKFGVPDGLPTFTIGPNQTFTFGPFEYFCRVTYHCTGAGGGWFPHTSPSKSKYDYK